VEVPGDADVIACRRSLEPLLATLPEAQRVVFVARVLEERSTAQVAEDLGVSPDLVRWRLRTARERLRAHVSRSI
jgi:RNA polymerase sigma factor (sigma-70 family)